MHMDQAALDEIIRRRRTIKPPMMNETPVPEEDLRAILENANWAPSHGLTEPWRFRIYRGAARAKLAAAIGLLYEGSLPIEEQKPGKADKLREMPLLAPVVMLLWMQRQKVQKIREIEEIEAVACAVQNMHLTATARGLGAFWSTPPILYKPEMNEWMGIAPEDRCLGIFYLGYPKDSQNWPKGRRQPIEDKIEWVDA
jgi:nitroreductase